MKLLSVNVGLPREAGVPGAVVLTAIFKQPVRGSVHVGRLNLEGDRQADLTVHGGRDKAVYAYPSEHYPTWRRELGEEHLPYGAFGENLTTEGLAEDAVRIGDRFRVGTAEMVVTQPRMPCFKLGIRFGRPDMVKRFFHSRRSGFYLAVEREGEVAAGDVIEPLGGPPSAPTVAEIVAAYARRGQGPLE